MVKVPAKEVLAHCLVQSAEEYAKTEGEEDQGEGSLTVLREYSRSARDLAHPQDTHRLPTCFGISWTSERHPTF